MSDDIHIRTEGCAGRITLNRPGALNALTWEMCLAIEQALNAWENDTKVALLIIDAIGEKAFCAGGDIADMYASGQNYDLSYGRRFWSDEYRMNAKIFRFPKPVVTFLQGFTMGGGVGVGCHGSHRIVDASSRIAMPECTIGLVPDVGGSLLLAQAPGRLGEFLGLTGDRMDAGDAIHCGFADYFIPEGWDELKEQLIRTGDHSIVDQAASPAPASRLADAQADIDASFAGETLGDIMRGLPAELPEVIAHAAKLMNRNAPLAMAVATQLIHSVRAHPTIANALDREYRYTYRAVAQGDFIEGIRAAIIDKDRSPSWAHKDWTEVSGGDVLKMTLPLGKDALKLEETP
ncbi:enoyl-CoA hydratase/isomerase family protein [Yoonia sp. R2331]|uniref:enoyl-CoA hydratase/isomerase family protein n=1 Tax=Yoonia sp. R2331 TaxID=3237238 RepID=UPI0034E4F461